MNAPRLGIIGPRFTIPGPRDPKPGGPMGTPPRAPPRIWAHIGAANRPKANVAMAKWRRTSRFYRYPAPRLSSLCYLSARCFAGASRHRKSPSAYLHRSTAWLVGGFAFRRPRNAHAFFMTARLWWRPISVRRGQLIACCLSPLLSSIYARESLLCRFGVFNFHFNRWREKTMSSTEWPDPITGAQPSKNRT
jgi:hypothetical protein